jgi:hypothetical protein
VSHLKGEGTFGLDLLQFDSQLVERIRLIFLGRESLRSSNKIQRGTLGRTQGRVPLLWQFIEPWNYPAIGVLNKLSKATYFVDSCSPIKRQNHDLIHLVGACSQSPKS